MNSCRSMLAITLLNEAWNSLSSATIAACWHHSKCLSMIQSVDSVNDGWDNIKQVEGDAMKDMYSVLESLKLKDLYTVLMLKGTANMGGIDRNDQLKQCTTMYKQNVTNATVTCSGSAYNYHS